MIPLIAVDVMSGEQPLEAYIKGAVNTIREFNVKLALVRHQQIIETALKKLDCNFIGNIEGV